MPKITATDRDGNPHQLDADDGSLLMEVLRDGGCGVEGTCGGAMSCGTCHVYVDDSWADKLAAASEDERDMLEAISEVVEVKPQSRLSCQLKVDEQLSGLRLTLAPEF